MRTLTGFLGPYFARMKWDIVKAGEGYSFVTSDSPVTFFNGDFLPPYEPGLRVSKNAVFGLNFLPGFWTREYRL